MMGFLLLLFCSLCFGTSVSVDFADNFPVLSKNLVLELLQPFNVTLTKSPSTGLFLVFGSSALNCNLDFGDDPEAFQVLANTTNGLTTICCAGNPSAMVKASGSMFATFSLLKALGFGFFHPMRPVLPSSLVLGSSFQNGKVHKPFFPVRGAHYHTLHPLDLTELFFGEQSVDKTWDQMLPEFALYLSWLSAHKVNRLEFSALCPSDKLVECQSEDKTTKYQTLVKFAHSFGIALFVDIAFALKQQHAMRMIYSSTLPEQLREIRASVDWALGKVFLLLVLYPFFFHSVFEGRV